MNGSLNVEYKSCRLNRLLCTLQVPADGFTCTMEIEWSHNHPTQSLQALSFKDIAPETEQKVKALFAEGNSPGNLLLFHLIYEVLGGIYSPNTTSVVG